MIQFLLNNQEISTDMPPGMLVLDFVRYHKHLKGTKIGCREGDCGACTILVGEIKKGELAYRSFTSCLTPLGNVHGKHVVTVEGVNMKTINPVQQAMADCSATQCGFCTPGFVVSLCGFCLSNKEPNAQNVIASIDGNICRCTGYKSIEKAAMQVADILQKRGSEKAIDFVVNNEILPPYFATIKDRLISLSEKLNGQLKSPNLSASFVGGGTDLYVQKHEEMKYADIHFLYDKPQLNGVCRDGNMCIMGAAATVTDLIESAIFQQYFPHFEKQVKLVSSTPIRNMATIAGNFINASPIGDFTIFFLALNAHIILRNGDDTREMPLRKLYKGYKILDKNTGEHIEQIRFHLPTKITFFNFEKVSKRTHLDIASANTAINMQVEGNTIIEASIAAGGVGPIPMYLEKSSAFLKGKMVCEETVYQLIQIAQTEIAPISDARGTVYYKRLLLGQLIKAHFITFFPSLEVETIIHF